MPMFDYKCDACGAEFEALRKADETETACKECGEEGAKRLVSAPGVKVTGVGTYCTKFYKNKGAKSNDQNS